MYYKIFNIIFRPLFSHKGAALLCLLCVGIVSCKKDLSDADTLQSKLASGSVSYVEGGNVVALNGNNYNFTPHYIGVPLTLTAAARSNDTISAIVDPSLVSQYNQLYLEKNPSISQGAFQVSHQGKFPLASGATQAKDSLYVILNDGSQLKDSTVYLVPVTLTAKSGARLKYTIAFFKVFVTKSDLKAKMYGASVIDNNSAYRLSSGALSLYYDVVPDSLKFRITLNTLFPVHDVSIKASLLTDSEVNDAIIKEGFPGYPEPIPMPANTGTFSKDLVTVPARSLLSRDSITFRFTNKANMQTYQWYVMGVKVISYTGSEYGVPPVANDSSRVYVRFYLYN